MPNVKEGFPRAVILSSLHSVERAVSTERAGRAYKKTGLLGVAGDKDNLSRGAMRLTSTGPSTRRLKTSRSQEWTTKIPALQEEQVKERLEAIAPIEARDMKVVGV